MRRVIFTFTIVTDFPKEIYFNEYVRDKICGAGQSRDLGVQLLVDDDDIAVLDARTRNMDEWQRCSVMFQLWRERQPRATWRQLIDALKKIKLNTVANDLENLLRPAGEQEQFSANQDAGEMPQKQNDGKSYDIGKDALPDVCYIIHMISQCSINYIRTDAPVCMDTYIRIMLLALSKLITSISALHGTLE